MAAKLVIGCGYLGSRVAQAWVGQGHSVCALTRRAGRAGHLRQLGIQPIQGDWNEPESLPIFPTVDSVFCSVGWDRSSGRTIQQTYVDGLVNLLQVLPDGVRRIVYVSSTGVYGTADGRWVDEQSVCTPTRAGGRACLDAERQLAASRFADRSVVLRLAGIYGPGRLPRLRLLVAGEPLPTDPNGLLNLIHVDDAARVALRAADFPFDHLPITLLVADGHPVRRHDFYAELARLYGVAAPRFSQFDPDRPGTRHAGGSKRVTNRRLLETLGMSLTYASYRTGLAAIARTSGSAG